MRTLTQLMLLFATWQFASLASAQDLKDSVLVVLISGFRSDPTIEQIEGRAPRGGGNSGVYQLGGDIEKIGLKTIFFNWNGTAAGKFTAKDAPGSQGIVEKIRQEFKERSLKKLVIVGHSWGGHTMLEVASELEKEPAIPITLAIGLDASSLSRGKRPESLSPAVEKLILFHTRNAFCWGAWKDEPRAESVDLGKPENGFARKGKPNYASLLDLDAHNHAEWDEDLHREIVRRIEEHLRDAAK